MLLYPVSKSIFKNVDHKRGGSLSLFNRQPESRIKVPSDARLRDHSRHGVGMINSMFFLDFILGSEEAEPGEKASYFIVFFCKDKRRSGHF